MAQQVAERWVVQQSILSWARLIGIGAAAGALFWVLSTLIGRYVVEPMVCRDLVDAAACVQASVTAGRVATVLVAVASVLALIRFGIARPIILAVASAIVLWNLGVWTQGLWWLEMLAWSVALYAATYALFGWIARQVNPLIAIVVTVVVVLVITLVQFL